MADRRAIPSSLVKNRSRTGAVAKALPTNGFDLQCPCSIPQANIAAATLRVRRAAPSPPVTRARPLGPVLTSAKVLPSMMSRTARAASALLTRSATFAPISGRMWRLRFDPSETQLLGRFAHEHERVFAALALKFAQGPEFSPRKRMRRRHAILDPTNVQDCLIKVGLLPTKIDKLGRAEPVPESDQDHRRVTVALPIVLDRLDEVPGASPIRPRPCPESRQWGRRQYNLLLTLKRLRGLLQSYRCI